MVLDYPWLNVKKTVLRLPRAGASFKNHPEDHLVRLTDHHPLFQLWKKVGQKIVTDTKTGMPAMASWCEDEAEGALPNGTRVIKRVALDGDSVAKGGKGTVVGSHLLPPDMPRHPAAPDEPVTIMYYIKWDALGDIPVATPNVKVEKDSDEQN